MFMLNSKDMSKMFFFATFCTNLCLFFYGTKKDSLRISRGNSPLMLASQKKMGALINVALITSHLFVVFKECNASPSNTTTQAQGDIFLLPVNCVRDR